jgi:hypothetical protein
MAPKLGISYKVADSGLRADHGHRVPLLHDLSDCHPAGFHPSEAAILAQAAQEIDDNHIPISVSKGTPAEYESVISRTMDILRPKHNERVYSIFHFIPGDPAASSAGR